MRGIIGIALGLALAIGGTIAVAGSNYTPPAASGGGVEGDGTGITDAAAFRTELGLGTAAVSAVDDFLPVGTSATGIGYSPADGADWTDPDPAEVGSGLDALAQRLADVEGAGWQAGSAALTDWSDVGVVSAADLFPYSTGAGVWAYGTVTTAGRSIIDDADAEAMRTTLGLGTAATAATGTSAGNVVVLDGSARLPAVDGSQLTGISGGSPDVQVFTADGTWSKPGSASVVDITCIGGGGGGAAGQKANGLTSSTRKKGGGGGGGGGYARTILQASALASTVAVTVGVGGAGGASTSTDGVYNVGADGEASSFGAHLVAAGGAGGVQQAPTTNPPGGAGGVSAFDGGAGGTGSNGAQAAGSTTAGKAAGGGGGGGGTGGSSTTAWSPSAGAAGTVWTSAAGGAAGTSGGSSPTAGSNGTSAAADLLAGGGGGGGGVPDYNANAAGANGGNGGLYGGGGGGGGGGYTSSGAGGNGADGVCVVVTYP